MSSVSTGAVSPDASAALIRTVQLTRQDARSGRCLLDEVHLALAAGERIGLAGPSGSGKSTLLRAIACLDPVSAGEVRFRDRVVRADEVPSFRRRVIYLPQRPAFVAGTVRENLQLPFRMQVSDQRWDESRVRRWLDQLQKPLSLLDQSVAQLSGGEQLIVSLLRAIALDPVVLLLDEPTSALDAESTHRFEQLASAWFIQQHNRAGWIWTSHDRQQILRMTDRVLTLANGRIDA